MRGTGPAVVFFAFAALVPVVVRDAFLLDGLILLLLWGATAAAWNVAGGYAGQVSLGHAAFFGLGAHAAALLGTRWALSPWLGLLVGAALATVCRCIIGFLSNRLRGPYFVLATIAFSQVLLVVASGGIGTPLGPFLGAIGAGRVGIYLIIYGVALIVMMRVAPQGLVPWIGERLRGRPASGTAP